MRTRSVRHLTAVTALALASMAAAAACSAAPVRPAAAETPPSATPSTSATPTPSPSTSTPPATTQRPPRPTQPQRCLGAVIYRVDASAARPPRSAVCITVGGVVRVDQLGPEGMTHSGNVSCYYEAAVHTCRLIKTGTVRFTITRTAGQTRELTVIVAKASTPPKPSPACDGVEKIIFDASQSGPPWPALCLKVGSVLRVENLGPGGLSAKPSGLLSCNYAAGVHECRFVTPGTVEITMTGTQSHALTVVAIK